MTRKKRNEILTKAERYKRYREENLEMYQKNDALN